MEMTTVPEEPRGVAPSLTVASRSWRSRCGPSPGCSPAFFDIAPVLVPLAATGLVVLMLLAAATHWRRDERDAVAFNSLIALLAAFVAWGRFGPCAS